MIQNDKELAITIDWKAKFDEAMKAAIEFEGEEDPIKRKLMIDAHQSMIETFNDEIADYNTNGAIKWE